MKKLSTKISVIIIALFGAVAVLPMYAPTALAETTTEAMQKGYNAAGGEDQSTKTSSLTALIKDVVNILLFILGAVAVIMIVIGGFKYVTSNGDQQQVTSAKNTIMYSVIGLVVAIMAFAIVNFVINSFAK